MHVSEGILSAPVLVSSAVTAVACTAIGLKKLNFDRIMNVSLLTATFFVASLIHVPLGPGSIHLVLNGLLGIILGWACFPAIIAALLLQALFFQYGGITVLGVNTMIMAGPAIIAYYLVRPWLLTNGRKRAGAAFFGGFLAIFLSSLLLAMALVGSDRGFLESATVIMIAHLPLMFIEGLVTMFTILFVAKVQPDFLQDNSL